MPYRLNRDVARHDFLRSRAPERAYIAQLAERDALIFIDNIAVDVENLIRRRFRCDPAYCVRVEQKNGRPWFSRSCCTDLLVEITQPEQKRLKHLADRYLARFPTPPKALAATARKILDGRFVFYTRKNEACLSDYRTNRCILSYLDSRGVLRCAINSMAEALGVAIERFKPDACLAFPIHYVDYEPDRWLLTVVCKENYQLLGASRDAAMMACLTRPPGDAPPAYVALRREIEHLWGARFWKQLDREARRLLSS